VIGGEIERPIVEEIDGDWMMDWQNDWSRDSWGYWRGDSWRRPGRTRGESDVKLAVRFWLIDERNHREIDGKIDGYNGGEIQKEIYGEIGGGIIEEIGREID
jgi:hypothetical protein